MIADPLPILIGLVAIILAVIAAVLWRLTDIAAEYVRAVEDEEDNNG